MSAPVVCPDTVVEAVRTDLLQRSLLGIQKYGVTLGNSRLSHRQYLQHAYEETLDKANYLKGAILVLDAEQAEDMGPFDPEERAALVVNRVCDVPNWALRTPLIILITAALRRAYRMGRRT